jgi:hypothetical protein
VCTVSTHAQEENVIKRMMAKASENHQYLPPFSSILQDGNKIEKSSNASSDNHTDLNGYSSQYKPSYRPVTGPHHQSRNPHSDYSRKEHIKVDTDNMNSHPVHNVSLSAPLFHPYARARSFSLSGSSNGLRSPHKATLPFGVSLETGLLSASYGDTSSIFASPGTKLPNSESVTPMILQSGNTSDTDNSNRNGSPPRSAVSISMSHSHSQISHYDPSLSPRRTHNQIPTSSIKVPDAPSVNHQYPSQTPHTTANLIGPDITMNDVAPNEPFDSLVSSTLLTPHLTNHHSHSVHCQCSVCKRMRTLLSWRARAEVSGGAY